MIETTIELATIALGVASVCLSLVIALRFRRIKMRLSNALVLNLLGEAVVGLSTIVFALASFFDMYADLSIATVTSLRWIIFLGNVLPSVLLLRAVGEIENER